MVASEISEIRHRRGLTFRGLADLAGTSPATLNAYERGRVSPTWGTFERIARSAGYEPVVDLLGALDAAAYSATALATDLAGTDGDADRLRFIVEFVDRWGEADDEQRRLLVHADPGSVGDRRWDALVGGLAEHLCWHAGLRAPSWVADPARFLNGRWWPVDLPTLRVWSFADTPASLARRGVMLSRRDLERV